MIDYILIAMKWLQNIIERLSPKNTSPVEKVVPRAMVIPFKEHQINIESVCPQTLKILHRLHKYGHEAYLVGGALRDLLTGQTPKDFDVATSAKPEEVKRLFSNCRLIGRRFRLAHIFFGRTIIEVATFRGHHDGDCDEGKGIKSDEGLIVRDNVFGTLEEDSVRRDFTCNALFYNVKTREIIDYTGGYQDIKNKTIRMIGDPKTRYTEDPVRMLRAVRFAAKLGFKLEEKTGDAIFDLKSMLSHVPGARLFDETCKLFGSGFAKESFNLLMTYGLFGDIFPESLDVIMSEPVENGRAKRFIKQMFINTDLRVKEDKPITPAFFLAALLWPALQKHLKALKEEHHMKPFPAMVQASEEVIQEQLKTVAIPKRFTIVMREIWMMQMRLPKRFGRKAFVLLAHPRFRAAYDFMLLREETGEHLKELCTWWTAFQEVSPDERALMVKKLKRPGVKK